MSEKTYTATIIHDAIAPKTVIPNARTRSFAVYNGFGCIETTDGDFYFSLTDARNIHFVENVNEAAQ